MNTPAQLFAPLFLLLIPSWKGWRSWDATSRELLKSREPWGFIVDGQVICTSAAAPYTECRNLHLPRFWGRTMTFWKYCSSFLLCLKLPPLCSELWTLFFFFASSFHNIIQTGWIFPSIKWHITLPSCVINFMDFSISCHDEPKFSNTIRLWLCISRHLMSVPITKIYHFLNLMASARGSFRLVQCGFSFLKSINYFVFKANFSFSLSGSFHGQNIASYIQWLVI